MADCGAPQHHAEIHGSQGEQGRKTQLGTCLAGNWTSEASRAGEEMGIL